MLRFQRDRKFLGPLLVATGTLGLVLPIIPGALTLYVGLLLLRPSAAEKMKAKAEGAFRRVRRWTF